jgi:hypothetical protein
MGAYGALLHLGLHDGARLFPCCPWPPVGMSTAAGDTAALKVLETC